MRLEIRHETVYTYTAPVSYTIQLLRLTPRQNAYQRVLQWTIDAPGRRSRHVDAYGNVSHVLVVDGAHQALRVAVHGVVDLTPLPNGRLAPEQRADDSGLPIEAFLVPTTLTAVDESIAAFAREALPRGLRSPPDLLLLAAAIIDRVGYVSGVTDVATPAARALAQGAGVCQDHAHLAIAVCRSLGVPARYVSGYIHPGTTEHVASHAWIDAWFAGAGWVSVDVTHGQFTSDWHCRVAVGRDYESASPVRGVRTGGGDEHMTARVLVTETPQQ